LKRFTQTEKWRDPWFRKLKPEWKLVWLYITDACDNAGVMELDTEQAAFLIGANISWKDFNNIYAGRVESFKGKSGAEKIWIPSLISFQNGKLEPHSPAHASIIKLLKVYGLWERYQDYLAQCQPDFIVQESEQQELLKEEKPVRKPKEDELIALIPDSLNIPEFVSAYRDWIKDRKDRKKPITELAAKRQLNTLDKLGATESIRWINCAIEKGWQGFYEPPAEYGTKKTTPMSDDTLVRQYAKEAYCMIKKGIKVKQFYYSIGNKIGFDKIESIKRLVDLWLNNPKIAAKESA